MIDHRSFAQNLSSLEGHAHGVGVQSLIFDKCPTFTQIFLLWTKYEQKQS